MPNLRPIRRAQLISPFGVGALVDFRGDESLMTAGLDEWPFANEYCPEDWKVREERLQARLGVEHFRLPPDFREQGPGIQHANQHIPFVRFPRWHYCPRRGAMEQLPLFGNRTKCPCRSNLDCQSIPRTRRPWLIPNRFIAVCRKGHIEDFPFMQWVHRENVWDDGHELRLKPGRSSAGLSGIRVDCVCGQSRTMAGVFNTEALGRIGYQCTGSTPWLGNSPEGQVECGEHLRVVQRGASNVYFPVTVSSIYLPIWGEDTGRYINKLLDDARVWDLLTSGLEEGKYIQEAKCEPVAAIYRVDSEELQRAAQRKLDGVRGLTTSHSRSEEDYRQQEYEALRAGRGGESTELRVDLREPSAYGQDVSGFVSGIGLVRKLRETRVLIGFSRVLPIEDPNSPDISPLALDSGPNWLPAIVVYGEGIFIDFDERALDEWMRSPNVRERVFSLSSQYNASRTERGMGMTTVTAKYVLLHTFAHTLVTQLSFDCGYGSAALRERIYCNVNVDDAGEPMQGILIYTASGDSEGTMGGLVRQGEPDRLTDVIRRAIHRISWCSSDPVCIESSGQGTDNANLAACHGCVLLAETSCETGNRLLDRGLLVGTSDDSGVGFFRDDYFG